MKKMLYIVCLVMLLGSCKQHVITEIVPNGKVLILVNSNSVAVDPAQSATKAVSDDGFNANSVIGLFSQLEEGALSELSNVKDENFGYKFTNESSYWSPINDAYTIYFKHDVKLSLYGYHPYTDPNKNKVTINSEGDRKLTFVLNPDQSKEESLYFNDLMYGRCEGISQAAPIADLKFSHKLCKVSFNIKRGANWANAPLLTDVSISGAELPTIGTMRLFDGGLVVSAPSGEDKRIYWSSGSLITGMTLNDLTPTKVDLLTLPYSATNTKVEFVVSGVKYEMVLPAIEFKSAVNVVYNIKLNSYGTDPIEIQTEIEDWEVVQSVNIKPY